MSKLSKKENSKLLSDGQSIDRRHFISKSSKFVAGGIMANSLMQQLDVPKNKSEKAESTLEYRTLGNTGLKVTAVGYGAMRTTDPALLAHALDLGINIVDTAHVYQGGNNEKLVGNVLNNRRKDVILCTKLKQKSVEQMMRDFEISLKRLKTDYIDILYLHSARRISDIQNEDYMKFYQKLKKQGKVRFIGFSTHSNETELVNQAAQDKFWDVILVAFNFSKEKALSEAIKVAAQSGIGIVAMKTQAGGYETEEMGDLSPHQAALKWVLQSEGVHTTIPGVKTFDELNEDFQVMNTKLGWNDRKTLYHYGNAIRNKYCVGCNACKEQCPYGVDIPEVNRCFMYYEGYRDIDLARSSYADLSAKTNASKCGLCAECKVICPHGIDIAARMKNVNNILV